MIREIATARRVKIMPKTKDAKTTKRRTKVKDLTRGEKGLSSKEQKKIKGGEDTSFDVSVDARGLAVGRGIRVRST